MCRKKLFPTESELIYGLRGQEINSAHRLSWHFNYSQKTDCQSKLWQHWNFFVCLFVCLIFQLTDSVFFAQCRLVLWNNEAERKKQSYRNSPSQLGSINDWSSGSWRTLKLLFRGKKTHNHATNTMIIRWQKNEIAKLTNLWSFSEILSFTEQTNCALQFYLLFFFFQTK